MRRSSLALLLIFVFSVPTFAQATRPSTRPTTAPADATSLIAQLGDEDWHVRTDAQDKIDAMGPSVLPQLQTALAQAQDPEVRSSLSALIDRILKEDPARPTLVSMRVTGASPKQVLTDLAKQSGMEIVVWPDWAWQHMKGNVTLNVDKQPFWIVMLDVCQQTGLRPQPQGMGSNRITLMQNGGKEGPVPQFFRDGFLFVARNAQRSHSIDFSRPKQKDTQFNLSLQVLVDPKIHVLRGPRELSLSEAVDDKGNSLVSKSRDYGLTTPSFGEAWKWDVSVPLVYRADEGAVLKSIKGSAKFQVVQATETWTCDPAKLDHQPHKAGQTQYTVTGFTKQQDGEYSLKFSVDRPRRIFGRNDQDMYDVNYDSMIQLLDEQGKSYVNGGAGGGGSDTHMEYEMSFRAADENAKPSPAAKIIWTVPTQVKMIDIPFEFKDLPIP